MKSRVPNENMNRQSYLRQKTEIRPLYCNLTPHGARNSKSPLVSLILIKMCSLNQAMPGCSNYPGMKEKGKSELI